MTVSGRHPVTRLLKKSHWRVLGINSGTSIDALDLALVTIREQGARRIVRTVCTGTYRFPPQLGRVLRNMAESRAVNKREVSCTHLRLGRWIGQIVRRFIRDHSISSTIDLIGCHGQTIGHFPVSRSSERSAVGATWQIGAAAAVALQSGIVTVGDFRTADIAAGGMGAPLSGYYHYLLFGSGNVVLNLGGIANLSAARSQHGHLAIMAFDTGPGNMVTDALAAKLLGKPYDDRGRTAARGEVDRLCVRRILQRRYFRKTPPKTCGREEFGRRVLPQWFAGVPLTRRNAPGLLATAVAVTAESVAVAIHRWIEPFTPARNLVVCGGGVRNLALMNLLRALLPGWTVIDSGVMGVHPRFVEPVGFALLAYETLHGRCGNRGGATGARPAVLGSICLP